MLIATAGHVDHGKTSLVRQITGTDTDRLQEEKARGLSIDLGFAYHHFDDSQGNRHTLGFVDVPGHVNFIKNLLAGVGAVDFALLVVAADDGIMPPTREPVAILDLLGLRRGAVALTKIDRAGPDRVERVVAEIKQLLHATALHDAPVFPLSNITGEGLESLLEYLQRVALTRGETRDRADTEQQYCRYSIDRSFTVKVIGTIVTIIR